MADEKLEPPILLITLTQACFRKWPVGDEPETELPAYEPFDPFLENSDCDSCADEDETAKELNLPAADEPQGHHHRESGETSQAGKAKSSRTRAGPTSALRLEDFLKMWPGHPNSYEEFNYDTWQTKTGQCPSAILTCSGFCV